MAKNTIEFKIKLRYSQSYRDLIAVCGRIMDLHDMLPDHQKPAADAILDEIRPMLERMIVLADPRGKHVDTGSLN